ncbi:MAG: hypothetical protein A3K83_00510 [Omnitrophica WOR_2 bacterium RBG_13_44_8b]|nr:MAG: hypothetical protein A3K83_00510 [Omnitrophica WOR_2 bacterium RBG_13_44_8b]
MVKLLNLIILILLILPHDVCLSQEPAKPESLSPETIGQGFEKAMKNIETEKLKALEELKVDLRTKLDQAIADWILAKKEEKAPWINKIVEQNWEFIPKYGPRAHYDYYLRGFDYRIISSDIVKTESLVSPYVGRLSVLEQLYAEMYHSPDVSFRDNFLYTVTTPIKVKFEYNGSDFVAVETEYEDSGMENAWPEGVKRDIFKKIF